MLNGLYDTATSIVGRAGNLASSLIGQAQKLASRPTRDHRVTVRAAKAPLVKRVATAAEIRTTRMAQVSHASPPNAPIQTVASEVAHLSAQVVKLTEDLTDYGLLPHSDHLENAKSGALFYRGQRFSLNSILANLAIIKSMTLHAPVEGATGLQEMLFPTSKPITVMTGIRLITNADEAVKQPGDIAGFSPTQAQWTAMTAAQTPSWPIGSFVFTGVRPHLVPDWTTAAKGLGVVALNGFGAAGKLFSLFSEQIGGFLGLGKGVDFARRG